MKKYLLRFGLLLITGLLSLVFIACGDEAEDSGAVQSVRLNRSTLALTIGQFEVLSAIVSPGTALDKTVTWASSDNAVATVNGDGTVTGVTAGTATITAKAGEKSATCLVTVSGIAVTGITLAGTLNTWVGANQDLVATVQPQNATDQTVTWISSNSAIATVDKAGKLTAVAAGTATITATSGTKTATCLITIKAVPTYGVLINGVVWAKYAMTEEGGKITLVEGAGMFYQWNRKKPWTKTGSVADWDPSADGSVDWARQNDPCPAGWRLPTFDQFLALGWSGRTLETLDGVPGLRFGSGDNTIFLPSNGYRKWQNGDLDDVGAQGNYWGRASSNAPNGVFMTFSTEGSVAVPYNAKGETRGNGYCVRCVAE